MTVVAERWLVVEELLQDKARQKEKCRRIETLERLENEINVMLNGSLVVQAADELNEDDMNRFQVSQFCQQRHSTK